MSKKLTPWFPASVKPVRDGVYERNFADSRWFSYWNGSYWSFTEATAKDAYRHRDSVSSYQNRPWRGLAQPLKE